MQMAEALKDAWNKACDYDKIPRGANFAAFSAGNPFAEKHDRLVRLVQMAARHDAG